MEVNICKICKKTFISKTKTFCCDECKAENERIFEQIEEYLVKYPNSNAMQLSANLGIPVETVVAFINEGRLSFSKGHFEKLDGSKNDR